MLMSVTEILCSIAKQPSNGRDEMCAVLRELFEIKGKCECEWCTRGAVQSFLL